MCVPSGYLETVSAPGDSILSLPYWMNDIISMIYDNTYIHNVQTMPVKPNWNE